MHGDRTIVKGDTKIVFVLRQPLYYACVSSWGEPESVVSRVRPMDKSLIDLCFFFMYFNSFESI